MDQQEMADLLEIQQLAARYMVLSARKDNDHWLEVFTPDGEYNAFGTPVHARALPDAAEERAAGPVHRQRPRSSSSTATPPPASSTTCSSTRPRHEMRLAWYERRVRAHPRRLAHPPALHHVHAPQRRVRLRQRARPGALRRRPRDRVGRRRAHRNHDRARRPAATRGKVDQMCDDARGGRRGRVRHRVDPAAPAGLRRHDRGRADGARDDPHRARHRGRAAAVRAIRSRSANRRCRCRRRATGGSASGSDRRTTGSSTTCSGCPTSSRRSWSRTTSTCSTRCSRARTRSTSRTTASASTTRSTSPTSPVPVLLAALGPVMLRIAGERADGTVLWMADERAIAEHVVPRITKAAESAGRPAPRVVAGVRGRACARPTRWTGARAGQPHARPRRVLAELPAAARAG